MSGDEYKITNAISPFQCVDVLNLLGVSNFYYKVGFHRWGNGYPFSDPADGCRYGHRGSLNLTKVRISIWTAIQAPARFVLEIISGQWPPSWFGNQLEYPRDCANRCHQRRVSRQISHRHNHPFCLVDSQREYVRPEDSYCMRDALWCLPFDHKRASPVTKGGRSFYFRSLYLLVSGGCIGSQNYENESD